MLFNRLNLTHNSGDSHGGGDRSSVEYSAHTNTVSKRRSKPRHDPISIDVDLQATKRDFRYTPHFPSPMHHLKVGGYFLNFCLFWQKWLADYHKMLKVLKHGFDYSDPQDDFSTKNNLRGRKKKLAFSIPDIPQTISLIRNSIANMGLLDVKTCLSQ